MLTKWGWAAVVGIALMTLAIGQAIVTVVDNKPEHYVVPGPQVEEKTASSDELGERDVTPPPRGIDDDWVRPRGVSDARRDSENAPSEPRLTEQEDIAKVVEALELDLCIAQMGLSETNEECLGHLKRLDKIVSVLAADTEGPWAASAYRRIWIGLFDVFEGRTIEKVDGTYVNRSDPVNAKAARTLTVVAALLGEELGWLGNDVFPVVEKMIVKDDVAYSQEHLKAALTLLSRMPGESWGTIVAELATLRSDDGSIRRMQMLHDIVGEIPLSGVIRREIATEVIAVYAELEARAESGDIEAAAHWSKIRTGVLILLKRLTRNPVGTYRNEPLATVLAFQAWLPDHSDLNKAPWKGEAALSMHWESVGLNCELQLPDTWKWSERPGWDNEGVVKVARRRLLELSDGRRADGEGAVLHLFVRDAPKGDLAHVARHRDVTSLLLSRFVRPKPKIVYDDDGLELHRGLRAVVMEAEGTGFNLDGHRRHTKGILVVTIAKQKLYLLRMYAFPTRFDEEGLKVDIDFTAYDGFDIIDSGRPAARTRTFDDVWKRSGRALDFESIKLRMMRHKELTLVEPQESEGEDVVVKFEGTNPNGSYTVRVIAIPLNRIVNGVQATPPSIKPAVTTDFWSGFSARHPKGAIFSYKWPTETHHKTMLTLPFIEDERSRVTVVDDGEMRRLQIKPSDILKKYRFAEKPRNNYVGKGRKVSEAYRGILNGTLPEHGRHYVAKFGFRTAFHTYRVYVGMYGSGYETWGDAIRKTLESMEFYE